MTRKIASFLLLATLTATPTTYGQGAAAGTPTPVPAPQPKKYTLKDGQGLASALKVEPGTTLLNPTLPVGWTVPAEWKVDGLPADRKVRKEKRVFGTLKLDEEVELPVKMGLGMGTQLITFGTPAFEKPEVTITLFTGAEYPDGEKFADGEVQAQVVAMGKLRALVDDDGNVIKPNQGLTKEQYDALMKAAREAGTTAGETAGTKAGKEAAQSVLEDAGKILDDAMAVLAEEKKTSVITFASPQGTQPTTGWAESQSYWLYYRLSNGCWVYESYAPKTK